MREKAESTKKKTDQDATRVPIVIVLHIYKFLSAKVLKEYPKMNYF